MVRKRAKQPPPIFCSRKDCQDCVLGTRETLVSPGLQSRPWDGLEDIGHPVHSKAVLLLGSHPGVAEDDEGKSFIGPTGKITNERYIKRSGLAGVADVYLGNAVRCAPRDRDNVTEGCLKRCRKWIEEDVRVLASHYQEVVVLCTGSKSVQGLLGHTQSFRTFDQGQELEIGGISTRVFATYLGAVLLPGRDPAKWLSVREHLLFLWRYLSTGKIQTKVEIQSPPESLLAGPGPPPDVGILSLDIETYGCSEGYPIQSVFHPKKSLRHDGVLRHDMVLTVGLTWRDPTTNALSTRVYLVQRPRHLRELLDHLQRVESLRILGSNIAFDVQYLWEWDNRFQEIIRPETAELVELGAVNFLQNDQRTERGLKNLSLILNIANYTDDPVDLKTGQRYSGWKDPRLWQYQAKDTITTLLTYETLVENMAAQNEYTCKWGEYSQEWFNDLTWECLLMAWNGTRYNRPRLKRVHERFVRADQWVLGRARDRWEIALGGKGSDGYIQELLDGLDKKHPSADLQKTKTGKWVADKEVRNHLLGFIPVGSPDRAKVLLWGRHKKFQKVVSSYTSLLLGARTNRDGTYEDSLVGAHAYPRVFPVPMYADKGGSEGGTQQGRITFKSPAKQTQPSVVEACEQSRFYRGAIVRADESQVELRIAAAWSGDPKFVKVFRTHANVHAATASLIAGHPVTKRSHPGLYHAGKTLNFLTLFFGGAKQFQQTCRREAALELPLRTCQQIIYRFSKEHQRLRIWQNWLVEQAENDGFLEIPLVGLSRSFLGDVRSTYVPTIVNFPVQTVAAMITESAMFEMSKWLRSNRSRSLCVGNTFDEVIYDCPLEEVEAVCETAYRYLLRPPFYSDLIDTGMTDVPLDVEIDVQYNGGRTAKWSSDEGLICQVDD